VQWQIFKKNTHFSLFTGVLNFYLLDPPLGRGGRGGRGRDAVGREGVGWGEEKRDGVGIPKEVRRAG
jgi:hypothetical protein